MAQSERDPTTGRFLMGHKGGPGAPKGHRRQVLADAFYAAVSIADVKAIVKTIVREAKHGDAPAARLTRSPGRPPCPADRLPPGGLSPPGVGRIVG